MSQVRILLVDDHDLFREGLAGIISGQPDMQVVGEAGDGLEALIKTRELNPDLVLMDIQMPGCDGLEAAQKIKKEFPAIVIVMLTVRDEDAKLFEALRYGAQGYLLKSIRSRELLDGIRSALRGEAAISPVLAGRMLEEFRRLSKLEPQDKVPSEMAMLTQREIDVLTLVAQGLSDKEIASQLTLSVHTVKSHLRSILAKLQVNTRREAAWVAKNRGMV